MKVLMKAEYEALLAALRGGSVKRKPYCLARLTKRTKQTFVRCGTQREFRSLKRKKGAVAIDWQKPRSVPGFGVPTDTSFFRR
jgi:hypothetical protein